MRPRMQTKCTLVNLGLDRSPLFSYPPVRAKLITSSTSFLLFSSQELKSDTSDEEDLEWVVDHLLELIKISREDIERRAKSAETGASTSTGASAETNVETPTTWADVVRGRAETNDISPETSTGASAETSAETPMADVVRGRADTNDISAGIGAGTSTETGVETSSTNADAVSGEPRWRCGLHLYCRYNSNHLCCYEPFCPTMSHTLKSCFFAFCSLKTSSHVSDVTFFTHSPNKRKDADAEVVDIPSCTDDGNDVGTEAETSAETRSEAVADETDPVVEKEAVASDGVQRKRVAEISRRRATWRRWLEENEIIPGTTVWRKWTRLEEADDVLLGDTVWRKWTKQVADRSGWIIRDG